MKLFTTALTLLTTLALAVASLGSLPSEFTDRLQTVAGSRAIIDKYFLGDGFPLNYFQVQKAGTFTLRICRGRSYYVTKAFVFQKNEYGVATPVILGVVVDASLPDASYTTTALNLQQFNGFLATGNRAYLHIMDVSNLNNIN
jgi:hypothetical protein